MSITRLVTSISDDVVAKIAAAGLPPLNDGKITIGNARKNETAYPPRVVFIPVSMRWAPPSPGTNASPIIAGNPNAPGSGIRSFTMSQYGGGYSVATVTIGAPDVAGGIQAAATANITSNGCVRALIPSVVGSGYLKPPTVTISGTGVGAAASANLGPTPQALAVSTQRSILTEWHMFLVDVWGVTNVATALIPDVDTDYDATQLLYQQVIASAHLRAAGVHAESGGKWIDALKTSTSIDSVGRGMRFMLEIATPLLVEPMVPTAGASVQIGPPQMQQSPTLTLLPFPGGTPESG
jgi:hypothetical protein